MYHVAYGLSLNLKSSHEVIIMRLLVAFAYFYSDFFSFLFFLLSIYFTSFSPLPLISLYFWAYHFLVAFTFVCYLSHLVCIV